METTKTDITLVSVAMATYNGAAWLPLQLQSILDQSYPNIELVVVDDASTDTTRSVLEEWREKDNRIKLFYNEKNTGYRSAFYRAISECKGEYILFSDQDDIWMPHKIRILLGAIGDNLLVFSDSALVYENGLEMNKKLSDTVNMLQPGLPSVNRGFVIGNCVWGHTILFDRSLLSYTSVVENDQPHDWWFAVVSSALNKISFCPEVLNHYRQHERNLTQAIPSKESKRKKIEGRKQEEYNTQLARLAAIGALPFNTDKEFYLKWHELYLKRTKGFSFLLFRFLLTNRKDIFCMKRKNFLSQMIAIRKMCRKVRKTESPKDRKSESPGA
jgi:glycosyltransferase involved in cell wall biosynthesis